MIILMHILVAVASLAMAGVSYLRPTKKTFQLTAGLTAATIASGTYLTILHPAHLLQTCVSGLLFVTAVTAISVFTYKKARQ